MQPHYILNRWSHIVSLGAFWRREEEEKRHNISKLELEAFHQKL